MKPFPYAAYTLGSVNGRVSPAPFDSPVAPFQTVPTRLLPASWHALQLVRPSAAVWSYPIAGCPPVSEVWHAVQVPAVTVGCGRLATPPWSSGAGAGGAGTVKPPTEMYRGKSTAPSQFGADGVPVPGQEWHDEQSGVPGSADNALWSSTVKPGGGFTFMWQLLQRPMVPSIVNGLPGLKLAWKDACAHSRPCTPGSVEAPACVWQMLHS